jgi:hypothetical protein
VTVLEEKLAGVDQALAELGKSDEDISALRARFANAEAVELQAVDGELDALCEGVHVAPPRMPQVVEESWDGENTEIEIVDESDFVLLVDESDLEELEKVGEDDALRTPPPAPTEEGEDGEEGDGFFKKLFGGRRTSNQPQ